MKKFHGGWMVDNRAGQTHRSAYIYNLEEL